MKRGDQTLRRIRSIREAFREASSFLEGRGIKDPMFEAELLLRHLLEWDRARFFMRLSENWPEALDKRLEAWLQRRAQGEPIQYIVGDQAFYGRRFLVNQRVLIPRPETEILVERVMDEAEDRWGHQALRVVDVGTGSGAIAITLALEKPHWQVTAIDLSQDALEVAKENARLHQVDGRIRWLEGSYLSGLSIREPIDILVSNPPYIPSRIIEQLEKQVRDYEPRLALDGGEDGLNPYREICQAFARWENKPRLVAFEIGYDQGKAVSELVKKIPGATQVSVYQDLAGLDRVVMGWVE